jgi:hypothetical protein
MLIYRKLNKTEYSSYLGISPLPTTYITLCNILVSKLNPYVDGIIGDPHYRFRWNISDIDKIFWIGQILGKIRE